MCTSKCYKIVEPHKLINLENYSPFTFLNTVNKKNLKNRLKKRKNLNRYDKFNFSFYSKVQNGFLKLAKNNNQYLIVNSNLPIRHNKTVIINKLKKLI